MELAPHKTFGNIRVLVAEEPWFCAKDVADALRYLKPRNAIKRHVSPHQQRTYGALRCNAEGGPETGPPPEVNSQTVFVNEAGLYSLVLGSKLPSAIAFKDWICEEVLPSIRRHGRYICGEQLSNELQLHTKLAKYIREAYPAVRLAPGLGELQATSELRIESWQKGYQKGQPDLVLHQRSGNFSGLAMELKTPKGTGVLSTEQSNWLRDLGRAGYRTLVSSSLEGAVQVLNDFMRNARVCCEHCGGSYASEASLRRHQARFHPGLAP